MYASGATTEAVGAAFGVTRVTIRNTVLRLGGKLRPYVPQKGHWQPRVHTLREDAFDCSSDPNAAYWVGFLMADGCVYGRRLSVCLAARDGEHVEKLRSFLGSTAPISARDNGGNGRTLAISSWRLVTALARYGVVPRKSLTAKVLGLEDDRDFWRGAVDGDGSVAIYTRRAELHLNGSRRMMDQFAAFVARHTGLVAKVAGRYRPEIARVRYCGSSAAEVARLLYEGSAVALERKAAVAAELMAGRGWKGR
jgi:hypothetical protein